MYAISLYQPWASFIAVGIKQFETRDWKPPRHLIGNRIAIHAAKKAVTRDDRDWASRCAVHDLPLGAIVCTALLIGVYQCGGPAGQPGLIKIARSSEMPEIAHIDPIGIPTDEFGDFSPGRWAWRLADIERLDPAIPAKGAQGFWKTNIDWSGQ